MREADLSQRTWPWIRPLRFTPGLLMMVLVWAGCDESERHKTMTFFFDGVPLLQGEATGTGPFDPNAIGESRSFTTGGWYVHEPLQDCTQCHVSQRRARFSRQVQLIADVPELCYRCHEEQASQRGWVHGPVATGDCLLCHGPHKTKNAFLLTKPAPELCHQCHEPETVGLIENHTESTYSNCIGCHEGHAGASTSLLRPAFLETEAGAVYRAQVYRQQYERALRDAQNDLQQGHGVSGVYGRIIDDIEADRLWNVRACLEVLLDSETIPEGERRPMAAILDQVTVLQDDPGRATGVFVPDEARTAWADVMRGVRDQRNEQDVAMARLYYRSVQLYHAGRLNEARAGFEELLRRGVVLEPVRETAQWYLTQIDEAVEQRPGPEN